MGTRRFFIGDKTLSVGQSVTLDAETSHHVRVLRLEPGHHITLCSRHGDQGSALIRSITATAVDCEIVEIISVHTRLPDVRLIQSLPKGDKLDDIVRMATEIGVSEIHLAVSQRTVALPVAGRFEKRMARFERIAKEASEQSRRLSVPHVFEPVDLMHVAQRAEPQHNKWVAWEEASIPLSQMTIAQGQPTWIVVGPEGGLDGKEITALRPLGFQDFSMGVNVLRVETAAPVAVALVIMQLSL